MKNMHLDGMLLRKRLLIVILVRNHIIPALHVGNKFLVPKKGLEDYIETARNNVKL